MKRTIDITSKDGILNIIGNSQESILYLRNLPIQYSWFAEIGSLWRYHIAQGLNDKSIEENIGIQALLRKGIQHEGDFLCATEYFSKFLHAGRYEFGYYELFEDVNWVTVPEREEYESFDYYGGCFDISFTQNAIRKELVDKYKEEISKGTRPVMVIIHVMNSPMFFILDGHHKFMAYKKIKIKSRAIVISKLQNDYLSLEETIQIARSMNCNKEEYINWMKSEKEDLESYKHGTLRLEELFREI